MECGSLDGSELVALNLGSYSVFLEKIELFTFFRGDEYDDIVRLSELELQYYDFLFPFVSLFTTPTIADRRANLILVWGSRFVENWALFIAVLVTHLSNNRTPFPSLRFSFPSF